MYREAPSRDVGFTIPQMLRIYFLHHHELLGELSRCAYESLKELMSAAFEDKPQRLPPQTPGTLLRLVRGGPPSLRFIRTYRVNDQLERATVAQPDRSEMTDVSSRDATDTEILGERDHGRVDEAEP